MTASVLLIAIVAMIFLMSPLLFAVTVALFFMVAAYEWAGLFGATVSQVYRWLFVILTVLGLYFCYLLPLLPLLILALAIWIWSVIALFGYQKKGWSIGFEYSFAKIIAGLIILVCCWRSITFLQANLPVCLLLVFCLCWLMDTGAFFTGRMWGKDSLASRISPKKTWQGFWGGMILSVMIIAIASLLLPLSFWQHLLIIPVILLCSGFAVVGDLFVSLLKRQVGVKDTGTILPGHGGLLDRVDSTLSTVPIFTLGYLLIHGQ
ncbi:MAG: phosphatidate cytidylyltransferase [Proteobacteria bacterium]|nr:phosphatidate cytidylyltransferase [Pseudomonadota bacterium]